MSPCPAARILGFLCIAVALAGCSTSSQQGASQGAKTGAVGGLVAGAMLFAIIVAQGSGEAFIYFQF